MTNTVNLFAESGADFIGDDVAPALTIRNSSTGAGLKVDKLSVSSGATVGYVVSSKVRIGDTAVAGNATTTVPLSISHTVSEPTVALINVNLSTASGAIISLAGQAFVSAVSLDFAASTNWAGMGALRIQKADGSLGWIPILPNAVVTAAAYKA